MRKRDRRLLQELKRAQPNAALAEMLARDGELDRILDGRGLTFEHTPEPPRLPIRYPPMIPPPPWSENYVPELDPDVTTEPEERPS